MKKLSLLFICILCLIYGEAQVKIHSHNDYSHPRPFFEALENKVFSMEADVFPVNGLLLVSHNKQDVREERTLEAMYIKPILEQFALHPATVSGDTSYSFSLLIDIKENPTAALKLLAELLNRYPRYFDRKQNPKAIRVIITGDQGDKKEWDNYPSYFYFDGTPYEEYSPAQLNRIAIFSDNYYKYFDPKKTIDSAYFLQTIKRVHSMGKPVRFWAAPDDEASWQRLAAIGVDIINTDHVAACRKIFPEK